MTRLKGRIISIAAGLLLLGCSVHVAAQEPSRREGTNAVPAIKIGIIQADDPLNGSGGCDLQIPIDYRKHRERHVFLSDFETSAWINIAGKDVELKLVASKEPKGGPRVGDRSFARYAAGNLKVRVDFIATKVCAPNDETCEITWYNATITVTRDGATARINVKGICGT